MTPITQVRSAIFIALAPLLLLTGCQSVSQSQQTAEPPSYEATVTLTPHGVAHITAASWGALGLARPTLRQKIRSAIWLALLQSRGESASVFGPVVINAT